MTQGVKGKASPGRLTGKESDPVQTLHQLLLCIRGCSEPLSIQEQVLL